MRGSRGASTAKGRSLEERDRLVQQYLPLVRHVVARLPLALPPSLGAEDLWSVGVLGLIHAATAYDPSRGASFKTFAFASIRGAVLDELRRFDPVPRGRRERLRRFDRALAALQAELDRRPTLAEVAERLALSSGELEEDLVAMHVCRTLSLDDGSPFPLTDEDPGEVASRGEQVELLARAIGELPETDRDVIVLYHYEELYLKEIGEVLGVTESRVSQILSRATARLRLKLEGRIG